MARSPEYRTSAAEWDGQMPIIINSGKLDLVNAVTEQNAFYCPFAATIVSIRSRVRTACGTAAGTAQVGKVGTADYFGTQAHATTDVAGTEHEWVLDKTEISPGDVIYFNGDGGATSTGDCDVTIVIMPKNQ